MAECTIKQVSDSVLAIIIRRVLLGMVVTYIGNTNC